MRAEESKLGPAALARLHWMQGGELADNPYPQGSMERESYMLAMSKLQDQEFQQELAQSRAGV